jgi:hypothetical protein
MLDDINFIIRRIAPLLILGIISVTAYHCLLNHWCMAGHNAHNQLDSPFELFSDIVIVSLSALFPVSIYLIHTNHLRTLLWFFAFTASLFFLNPISFIFLFLSAMSFIGETKRSTTVSSNQSLKGSAL